MKLKITLAVLAIAQFAFAQDGAPASPYYNGFNFTQTGTALKSALATKITTTHTHTLTYAQAENALKVTDLDPDDPTHTNLLLLYGFSPNTCPTSSADDKDHRTRNMEMEDDGSAASCMWNREHTFPKALGNPNLGTTGPGGDAHNLRACDKKRNADRNNDMFFEGSGNSFETGSNWYPGDEWKGDVARIIMYMYLRYGNQCLPSNVGVGSTIASDSNMPNLFLQWNSEDPVSQSEDARNTYLGVATNTFGQGNRNPFIDNPYLATLIWGGPVAQNRWPFLSTDAFAWTQSVSVFPNPSHGIINISSELDLESIRIFSVNGQLIQSIENPVFSNHQFSIGDLPKGFYLMQLKASGSEVVKKIIVN